MLTQYAERRIVDFPEILGRIDSLLSRVSPLGILSSIAGWGMLTTVKDSGADDTSILKGISQHHIELLQALILRHDQSRWGAQPAIPADIQAAIDDIRELTDAFHQRRYLQLKQDRSDQEGMTILLQEKLRSHTQVVRNWGYGSSVRRIARTLFAPLDSLFRGRHGFAASELLQVAETLEAIVSSRLNARFQILKRIARAKTIRQLVRLYYRDYPGVEGDPEAFIKAIPPGTSLQAVQSRLLAHADLTLMAYLSIFPADVAKPTGLTEDIVRKILDCLSHEPGDLSDNDPEHLFLANPVWLRPGIKLRSVYYFSAPGVIFSFIFPLMRSLCDTEDLQDALRDRRADYLEQELEAAFRAAFPSAQILANFKWQWEGTPYENDLIVLFDKAMLVLEAKSAGLSAEGLRGAPKRVKRHVQELVVAPAIQSDRLAQVVGLAQAGNQAARSALSGLPFDLSDVSRIARASVTLEDFSILASSEDELRRAGWVPEDVRLAPTMNLADLLVVLEILERPLFVTDYFLERERFQKSLAIHGDELDFLGMYLDTGFNIPTDDEDVRSISISGMSKEIDRYFTSRDVDIHLKKPSLALAPYFLELIGCIEARGRPGWIELGLALLHLGNYHEQMAIQRALEGLRKSVPRKFRDEDARSVLIVRPGGERDTLGLFYVHTNRSGRDPKEVVANSASAAMEEVQFSRCLCITRVIEDWAKPYTSLGIYTAED